MLVLRNTHNLRYFAQDLQKIQISMLKNVFNSVSLSKFPHQNIFCLDFGVFSKSYQYKPYDFLCQNIDRAELNELIKS